MDTCICHARHRLPRRSHMKRWKLGWVQQHDSSRLQRLESASVGAKGNRISVDCRWSLLPSCNPDGVCLKQRSSVWLLWDFSGLCRPARLPNPSSLKASVGMRPEFSCVSKLSKSQTDSVMFRGIRGMKQAVRLHIPRISTESERCKCLRLAVAELTAAFMPISKSKVIGLNIFPGSLKFLCPALMPAATAKFCRFFLACPQATTLAELSAASLGDWA